MGAAAIRILGLDPGLSAMGWGVIALEGTRLSHIAHGVIATKPPAGLGLRLMTLHRELTDVIAQLIAPGHRGGAGLCRPRSARRR